MKELSAEEKRRLVRTFYRDYDRYRTKFTEWYAGYRFPEFTGRQKRSFLPMRDIMAITEKEKTRTHDDDRHRRCGLYRRQFHRLHA